MALHSGASQRHSKGPGSPTLKYRYPVAAPPTNTTQKIAFSTSVWGPPVKLHCQFNSAVPRISLCNFKRKHGRTKPTSNSDCHEAVVPAIDRARFARYRCRPIGHLLYDGTQMVHAEFDMAGETDGVEHDGGDEEGCA